MNWRISSGILGGMLVLFGCEHPSRKPGGPAPRAENRNEPAVTSGLGLDAGSQAPSAPTDEQYLGVFQIRSWTLNPSGCDAEGPTMPARGLLYVMGVHRPDPDQLPYVALTLGPSVRSEQQLSGDLYDGGFAGPEDRFDWRFHDRTGDGWEGEEVSASPDSGICRLTRRSDKLRSLHGKVLRRELRIYRAEGAFDGCRLESAGDELALIRKYEPKWRCVALEVTVIEKAWSDVPKLRKVRRDRLPQDAGQDF